MTSDRHLQEPAEEVLERSCNFAPSPDWDNKRDRMQRVVTFTEQRHFLSLARAHGEDELQKKITDANRFHIRLTNMIRDADPTSKIMMTHYRRHYANGSTQALADLLLNICFCRNTMSRSFLKLCEQGEAPWLHIENDRITDASAKAVDEVYLKRGAVSSVACSSPAYYDRSTVRNAVVHARRG